MKLPFVLRKKYDAIQNKNLKLMNNKSDLESEVYLLGLKYKDLKKEVKTLRNDLNEKSKELDLAKQYNDIATNKVCELNTKLIAATTKNEELEAKIKEL